MSQVPVPQHNSIESLYYTQTVNIFTFSMYLLLNTTIVSTLYSSLHRLVRQEFRVTAAAIHSHRIDSPNVVKNVQPQMK